MPRNTTPTNCGFVVEGRRHGLAVEGWSRSGAENTAGIGSEAGASGTAAELPIRAGDCR